MKSFKVNRILSVLICVVSFASGSVGQTSSESAVEQKKPNIIFILADDLGYGDVSAYNEHSKIQTKNIDRLANSGVRFTDAHTSSAVCMCIGMEFLQEGIIGDPLSNNMFYMAIVKP